MACGTCALPSKTILRSMCGCIALVGADGNDAQEVICLALDGIHHRTQLPVETQHAYIPAVDNGVHCTCASGLCFSDHSFLELTPVALTLGSDGDRDDIDPTDHPVLRQFGDAPGSDTAQSCVIIEEAERRNSTGCNLVAQMIADRLLDDLRPRFPQAGACELFKGQLVVDGQRP